MVASCKEKTFSGLKDTHWKFSNKTVIGKQCIIAKKKVKYSGFVIQRGRKGQLAKAYPKT